MLYLEDKIWVGTLSFSLIYSFLSYLKESMLIIYSWFLQLLKVFFISVSSWEGSSGCLWKYFCYSQKPGCVTVVGKIMVPKDVHTLEPVTISPCMIKIILQVWLRILICRDYPVLFGRSNMVTKVFIKWRKVSEEWQRRRYENRGSVQYENRAWSPGEQPASSSWRSQDAGLLPSGLQRKHSCLHLDFRPGKSILNFGLQNFHVSLYCFKSLSLQWFFYRTNRKWMQIWVPEMGYWCNEYLKMWK